MYPELGLGLISSAEVVDMVVYTHCTSHWAAGAQLNLHGALTQSLKTSPTNNLILTV